MLNKKIPIERLIFLSLLVLLFSCANPPKTLDPSVSGPQLIVNPEWVRLSVSKMKDTNIIFEGAGFNPGDSVLITLTGPQETKVIAAEASINPDGTFKAPVPALTKVMEFLRADITFNENFENVIILSQPPIPKGIYTARVESMISKQVAETKLSVKGPTILDRLKDWIGKLTGKIKHT